VAVDGTLGIVSHWTASANVSFINVEIENIIANQDHGNQGNGVHAAGGMGVMASWGSDAAYLFDLSGQTLLQSLSPPISAHGQPNSAYINGTSSYVVWSDIAQPHQLIMTEHLNSTGETTDTVDLNDRDGRRIDSFDGDEYLMNVYTEGQLYRSHFGSAIDTNECPFGTDNRDVVYIDADTALLLSAGTNEVLMIDVEQMRTNCTGNPIDSVAIDSGGFLMDLWTAPDTSNWLVVTHPVPDLVTIVDVDSMTVDTVLSWPEGADPTGVATTDVSSGGVAVIVRRWPDLANGELAFLDLY
jgi:hypothetical protein